MSHELDGGDGRHEVITWVGEQRLMEGYCGRAPVPGDGTLAAADPSAGDAMPALVRPVAFVRVRPRQGRVIRIGPPRVTSAGAAAADEIASLRAA